MQEMEMFGTFGVVPPGGSISLNIRKGARMRTAAKEYFHPKDKAVVSAVALRYLKQTPLPQPACFSGVMTYTLPATVAHK